MAQAELNDGQRLLAVNDLFVGAANPRLGPLSPPLRGPRGGPILQRPDRLHGRRLDRAGIARSSPEPLGSSERTSATTHASVSVRDRYRVRLGGTRRLVFSVREPFVSKTSGAEIVHGTITASQPLEIISQMPQNGVIFSDGVEEDRLDFNSGAIARIGLADRTLRLVIPPPAAAKPGWRGQSGQK